LLFGHRSVWAVAVDPKLRWIASTEQGQPVVRMWPMPTGKPLQTLPYNDLLARLRELTNVRIAPDRSSSAGYGIRFDPFPGWEKKSEW
jgi:hypothetical protein